MPNEQHAHGGRRPNFHRGRRGPDRRGERRPQSQPQSASEPAKTDGVDVDQIVREIKARIAQRHGIDLSSSQIQELAARRLDAILDPRTIKPSLLEQLRRSAGAPADIAPVEPSAAYAFEDHTIFDTHNGLLRSIRRLLQPILKLFFNPNPIAHALNAQAKINKDAAKREEARERTQAEWNALHYALVQRLVTEIARTSIDTQNLSLKVEALATRVDFYERRVRGLESTTPAPAPPAPPSHHAQPMSARPARGNSLAAPGAPPGADGGAAPVANAGAGPSASGDASGDGTRRRRRRRRGRRGPGDATGAPIGPAADGGHEEDEGPGGSELDGPGDDSDATSDPQPTWTASAPEIQPAQPAQPAHATPDSQNATRAEQPAAEPASPAADDGGGSNQGS
jgi:hypothetical protein